MDIKYPIENEYMNFFLQIYRFSGSRPRVRSSRQVESGRVGSSRVWRRDIIVEKIESEDNLVDPFTKALIDSHVYNIGLRCTL